MRLLHALLLACALPAASLSGALAQAGDAELVFWNIIQDSADPAEFRAYLEAFPEGVFAPLARVRINQLESGGGGGTPASSSARRLQPEEEEGAGRPSATGISDDIGFIGIEHAALTEAEARDAGLGAPRGARIVAVLDGGPADRAGLRADDIVLKIGGFPVATMEGLVDIVTRIEPGRKVDFEIIRDGRRRALEVTVGGFLADNLAAANAGDPVAMLYLSSLYASGRLDEPDPDLALEWLNKAVGTGDTTAIVRLARAHWDGTLMPQDRDEALRLYEEAAGKGDALASHTLASIHDQGLAGPRDLSRALQYYRRAGEAGNAAVYPRLGEMYEEGEGTAENPVEAARWYRKAAENEDIDSLVSLAIMLHIGEGVAQDHLEAARLYQRVLDLGGDDGSRICYNYSLLYANGDGVAKDERKGVDLLYRAIRAGDSFAVEQITTNPDGWSRDFRRMLQTRLREDGFYDGAIDGAYGPGTRGSIELASKAGPVPAATATASPGRAGGAGLGLGRLEDFSSLD